MRIFNIIVTYNRALMLQKVLDNLVNFGFDRVIIINNCSTDNTLDVVEKYRSQFKVFHLVNMEVNLGGAGGFNEGLRQFTMLADIDDYALLHDDDSWPEFKMTSLNETLNLSSEEILLGCFPVLHPNGDLNRMNVPGLASFLRKSLKNILRRVPRRPANLESFNSWTSFEYSGFVGFLIRKDVVVKVGLPSKNFFIYSDDTTYTYLCAHSVGFITNLYKDSNFFVHDCKRSTGRSLIKSRFGFYEVRNKIIFLRIASEYSVLFSIIFLIKCIFSAPEKIVVIFKGFFFGFAAKVKDYLPTKL